MTTIHNPSPFELRQNRPILVIDGRAVRPSLDGTITFYVDDILSDVGTMAFTVSGGGERTVRHNLYTGRLIFIRPSGRFIWHINTQ